MNLHSVPLSSLADVRSGGDAPQETSAFTTTGHPFVRAGSLIKLLGGASEESLEKLEPAAAEMYGLNLFAPGTVLFAKSGMSATKGYIYCLQSPAYVVNHLAALVPHDPKDSAFLVHLLQRFPPTVLIRDPAYPSIRLSDIEDMKVLAPSDTAERQQIVEVLDRAQDLRAKRRAAMSQLDTLSQALFLDLFGNPTINPKGWPLNKLGDIGMLERGVSKHRPRNAPELLNGPYPLVQTGDVANSDGYIRSYNGTYSDRGLRQSKQWPAGTLCITIAANIAKTGILTFDACFPDSVVGFRSEDTATIEFVRVWFSFLQKTLEDIAPESAQKNINLAILRDLDIPIPPLTLQHDFARRIEAVEKLKTAHRTSLGNMDELLASLQYRAFRGEI